MSGGNFAAECSYGTQKISPDASKEEKQRYVINKYEKRLFAPMSGTTLAPTVDKGSRPQTEVGNVNVGRTNVSVAVAQTFSVKLPPARPIASSIPDNVFHEMFHDWGTSPKANTASTVTKSAMESDGAVSTLPDDLFLDVEGSVALPLDGTLRAQGESSAPPDCALQERKFVNALDDVDEIFAVLHVA